MLLTSIGYAANDLLSTLDCKYFKPGYCRYYYNASLDCCVALRPDLPGCYARICN